MIYFNFIKKIAESHNMSNEEQNNSIIESKENFTNKRIDFDEKTFTRLKTMLPIYSQDVERMSASEKYSYVVRLAVNKLFDSDFKTKIEEL